MSGIFLTHSTQTTYLRYDVHGDWTNTHGVIAAAGIEKRLGPVRFAPEVRYTYWTKPSIDISGTQDFYLQSTRHQPEILVAITVP